MPKHSDPGIATDRSLALTIAAALAVKAVALAVIYLAFFVPAPRPTPISDVIASAILGPPP